jgi:hypothetical protein
LCAAYLALVTGDECGGVVLDHTGEGGRIVDVRDPTVISEELSEQQEESGRGDITPRELAVPDEVVATD